MEVNFLAFCLNRKKGEVMEREVYEGLIIATLLASAKKIKTGLCNVAKGKYQDYPEGTIEIGIVLDAVDMLVEDVVHCIMVNNDEQIDGT